MANPLLDPDARLVIAHRGGGAHAPENTIAAILRAVDGGADAVECDVRLTRDGVPVLLHDETLDRTSRETGPLARRTLREVASISATRQWPDWAGGEAHIPRLEDVLDRFRRTPFVLEIKEPAAVAPTVDLIRRLGLSESVVLGSLDDDTVPALRASGLPTCASPSEVLRFVPRALVGLPPRRPSYGVLSLTPHYYGLAVPVTRLARVVRRAAVATHVWTVNRPEDALRLWRGGVAGIITDDPPAMIRARPR